MNSAEAELQLGPTNIVRAAILAGQIDLLHLAPRSTATTSGVITTTRVEEQRDPV